MTTKRASWRRRGSEWPVLFWLAAAPWLYGGMAWPAQLILAGAAALAYAFSFLGGMEGAEARSGRRARSVATTSAVLFVVYLVCQHLNPWGRPVLALEVKQFVLLDPVPWLPSGLDTPPSAGRGEALNDGNSLRYAVVFGTALLIGLACFRLSSRPGFGRKVATVLALSGTMAVGLSAITWLRGPYAETVYFTEPVFHRTSGPFLYKNLSAGWWVLTTGAAVSLAMGTTSRGRVIGLALAGLPLLGAVLVQSVAGAAAAGFLWGCALLLTFRQSAAPRWTIPVSFVVGVAAIVIAFRVVAPERLVRLRSELATPAAVLQGGQVRANLHRMAWEMARDRLWFGYGGGSYCVLVQAYKDKVPEWERDLRRGQPQLNRLFVKHADGDWWEFLVEYGVVGTGLLVIALGALLVAGGSYTSRDALGLWWGAACSLVMVYGCNEVLLRNPVIAATLAGMLAIQSRRG